jgi:hypothetical protein
MAYVAHKGNFGLPGNCSAPVANGVVAKLKGLARRLIDALEAPHRTEVDRRMARLMAQSGGRLTDSMEREVFLKAFASDWGLTQ